jgi:predicted AAA+ superfamily ATPase
VPAAANRDLRPSRYVLTGSTRYAAIPAAAQALTGRVDIIPVLALTQGEIDGVRETFVARLPAGRSRDAAPAAIYRLPSWGTTPGSRVVKHSKVHMVDSGVMAS